MVRGLTPLYFPCNGNTEKGAFPTFYDEITLLNVVKYTCYQADGFKRSDWATSPLLRQRMPKTLYTREIHIQNSYTERSIQMPKVMIIECSDEEADRLVEQIKGIIAEPQYQPFRGPGKVYEFGSLRIDQPKREVTLHGNAVKLNHREFEILGLFASTRIRPFLRLFSTMPFGFIQIRSMERKKLPPMCEACRKNSA